MAEEIKQTVSPEAVNQIQNLAKELTAQIPGYNEDKYSIEGFNINEEDCCVYFFYNNIEDSIRECISIDFEELQEQYDIDVLTNYPAPKRDTVADKFELRIIGPGELKYGEEFCQDHFDIKDIISNTQKNEKKIINLDCYWFTDVELINCENNKPVLPPYKYNEDYVCDYGYITANTLFEGVLDGDSLFVRHKDIIMLDDGPFEDFINTIECCQNQEFPCDDENDKRMINDYNKINLSFENIVNLEKKITEDSSYYPFPRYYFPIDKQYQQEFSKLFINALNDLKEKENLPNLNISPLTEEITQKYSVAEPIEYDINKNAKLANKTINKDINKKK